MLVILCLAAVFAISTSVAGVVACDDDPCSQRILTELGKIRDDVRAVKSLVEGLHQKACPEGFEYLPEVRSCYKVIEEMQEWSSANGKCQSLAPGAHLISLESQEEGEAVTKYLKQQLENPEASKRCKQTVEWPVGERVFWTSGQRVNTNDCKSEFVWKTTATGAVPLTYKQWSKTEPNCSGGVEKCLQIRFDQLSEWNDKNCDYKSCSVCEYDLN